MDSQFLLAVSSATHCPVANKTLCPRRVPQPQNTAGLFPKAQSTGRLAGAVSMESPLPRHCSQPPIFSSVLRLFPYLGCFALLRCRTTAGFVPAHSCTASRQSARTRQRRSALVLMSSRPFIVSATPPSGFSRGPCQPCSSHHEGAPQRLVSSQLLQSAIARQSRGRAIYRVAI